MSASTPRADRAAVGAAYATFLVLVWGLFALDRGYIQDEPWIFAALRDGRSAAGIFYVGNNTLRLTPLRPLAHVGYGLALLTSSPRAAMQVLEGLVWLAGGLSAAALLRRLRPGRPLAAFLAGALVLTACGDHTVNNLAYQSSYAAAAGWLLALVGLVEWQQSGSRRALWGAAASLAFGLLTYDGLVAAAVFTPLLAYCFAGLIPVTPDSLRRRRVGVACWCALALPYAAFFALLLRRQDSYLERVLTRPTPSAWFGHALDLFALNLTPWRWRAVFVRPEDGTGPQALPEEWRWALLALGLLAFAWVTSRLWRRQGVETSGQGTAQPLRRALPAILGLLACAAFSNAAVALVSPWPFRTQLASRLCVSLALALAIDVLIEHWRRRPALGRAALLVPAAFVAWGLDAGLASQDMYLTLWRRHRAELRSLLEQVPGLRPGAWLLLRVPADAGVTSFYFPEVGGPWLDLLYGSAPQLAFWNPRTGRSDCALQGESLFCRDAGKAACYASGACVARVLPLARMVLCEYVPASGRVELRRELPADVLAPLRDDERAAAAQAYVPAAAIMPWPRTDVARELLDQPELLARFFPGRAGSAGRSR